MSKSTSGRRRAPSLDDCPCAGRNLDKFIQPALLAGLADGPLHGYLLLKRLAAMPVFHGQRPDAAGVYRFLRAMEDRGLVTSAWDLSETGPAKRLFDLTGGGRKCLARWAATMADYHDQVGQLVKLVRRAAGKH